MKPKRKSPAKRKKKTTKTKPKPQRPLWSLEQDGITNTGLQTFMSCREKFARKYIDGMSSRKISVPLTFGNLWHLAFEYRLTRTPWKGVDLYRTRAAEKLNSQALADLDHLVAQVKAMFPYYTRHYKKDDGKVKFIAHEHMFEYEHQVGRHKIKLRGKIDGVYKTSLGSLGLWEIKTKSKIDTRLISDLLRCDFQTLLYLWATWKSYKKCPRHLTYDVIKRPQLRQKKTETQARLIKRIQADVIKNPGTYFKRWPVTIMESDLARFQETILDPVLLEFADWNREVSKTPFLPERRTAPRHYQNLSALVSSQGRDDLYDLVVKGNRAAYYRRSYAHPELDAPGEG